MRFASNNFISISYHTFLFNLITSFKLNWCVSLLRKTISRQRNPLIAFCRMMQVPVYSLCRPLLKWNSAKTHQTDCNHPPLCPKSSRAVWLHHCFQELKSLISVSFYNKWKCLKPCCMHSDQQHIYKHKKVKFYFRWGWMILYSQAWFPFTANSTTTTQKTKRLCGWAVILPTNRFVLAQNWSLSWPKLAL